jgi:putative addiction module component (TIGR02574 family)
MGHPVLKRLRDGSNESDGLEPQHGPQDAIEEIDAGWEAELERRDAELDDGTVQGVPLSEFTAAVERRRAERAIERIAAIGLTTREGIDVADVGGEVLQKLVAVNDLLAELLLLSREERAKIAHELLRSLEEPLITSVEDEWDVEIDRRGAEVDAGTADTVSFEEYEARMRERRAARERR